MSIEITPRDQAMASAIAGLIQKEASLDDVKKAAGNAADKIESMAKSTADVVKDGYNKVEEKASAKFRPVLAKLKAMFEQGKKTESAPTKKSEKDGKQVPVAKAGAEKEAALTEEDYQRLEARGLSPEQMKWLREGAKSWNPYDPHRKVNGLAPRKDRSGKSKLVPFGMAAGGLGAAAGIMEGWADPLLKTFHGEGPIKPWRFTSARGMAATLPLLGALTAIKMYRGQPRPRNLRELIQPSKEASVQKEAAAVRWPFKAALGGALVGGTIAAYPAWKRMLWGDVTRQRYGSENWKNKVMQEYQLKKDEQEEKMRKYVGENFIPDQFGGYTNPQTGTIMGPRAMHARIGFMNQQAQGARDAWIRQQFNSMRRQELAGHTSVPEQYQTGLDKVFEDFKTKYNAPMEGAGGSDPKSWKAFALHLAGNPGMYRGVPYFRGWNPQTLNEAELREKFEGMIPGRGSV